MAALIRHRVVASVEAARILPLRAAAYIRPLVCTRAHALTLTHYMSTAADASASSAARPAVSASTAAIKQLREQTGAPLIECKKALEASNGDVGAAVDLLRAKGVAAARKKAGRTAAQGVVAIAINDAGDTATMVEVNSETDFVARNTEFQTVASRIASAALTRASSTPDAHTPSASPTTTTGVSVAAAEALEALNSTALPGDAAGTTVGAALTDTIAKIRENIVLRRSVALHVPRGHVCAYVHNSSMRGVGSVGVLLGIRGKDGAEVSAAGKELAKKLAMHVAAAKPAYLSRDRVPAAVIEKERAVLMAAASTSGKPANIVQRMVDGRLGKFYSETVLLDQPYILNDEGKSITKVLTEAAKTAGPLEIVGFAHFVVGEASEKPSENAESA